MKKDRDMEIEPRKPSNCGTPETFQGDVWYDVIADGVEVPHVRASTVHFSPGARSAWHSHARGQILYVTEGEGLAQSRGDEVVKLRAGDIVYTAPEEWHWHGAAPDRFMTHLSMSESIPDATEPDVTWGPHVTDDEYLQSADGEQGS
jgi:quercetin dioxygenase-like cupin family protein